MARSEAPRNPGRGSAGVSPIALVLPLAAGFGYACGAVAIKRALRAGASGDWVNLFCNTFMAVLFQGLWLLPGHPLTLGMILPPVVCGVLFFLGQILHNKSLQWHILLILLNNFHLILFLFFI